MYTIIQKIINNWDPISLTAICPSDEYQPEIENIVDWLLSNEDIEEGQLANKIHAVFSESFGTDLFTDDTEKCSEIAKAILEEVSYARKHEPSKSSAKG